MQARHTISVAVVVGAQRERAARLMKALSQQTLTERLEVIVIDTRPHAPALEPVSGPVMKILRLEACSSYGEARARAVREATGEIVAFLEDHCYPQPGWAEALAAAYGADSAAIGYSFANANPGSLVSRIVHLATYGEWEAPERDAVRSLPGGNVSYRREHLLELGDGLPAMLEADFNLHAWMLERGLMMSVEPRARVEHESEESVLSALRGSFVYSRVLAAKRADAGGWGTRTRLVVAAKDLVGAPLARLARLLSCLPSERRRSFGVRTSLPAILALYLASSVGELFGYLAGEGGALGRLLYWELDAPRAG